MPLQSFLKATEHFYDWELRGRGWHMYDHPVCLEPAFVPFRRLNDSSYTIVDDGRRPRLLSSFIDRITRKEVAADEDPPDEEEYSRAVEPDASVVQTEFEILVPAGEKVPAGTSEALVRACGSAAHPVSYELAGSARKVSLRMSAAEADASALQGQLRSLLPGAVIREPENYLTDLYFESEAPIFGALDFGLAREFMLPLRSVPQHPDPMAGLIGAVASAPKGALAVLQVLFTPARELWGPNIGRAVTTRNGEPFFLDAPELTRLAAEKCEEPLFAVILRAVALGKDEEEAGGMLARIAGALGQYGDAHRNSFTPLGTSRGDGRLNDFFSRSTYRSGMLLSLSELGSIVRLPSEHVRHEALIRSIEPEKVLPADVRGEGIVIGSAEHEREMVPVHLTDEARLQHTHVLGGSGTGKSTLLVSMILGDIEAGHGVGVVDPHGDLADEVLGRIPASRRDDVIILDPSDPDWTVGWNILGAHSDVEKELLSSDLVAVFKRLSNSWGDQMSAVLGNAVHAFLESRRGGTLSDLRKFLLDETFRTAFLSTVEDDHVISFWKEEFPLLASKKPQAPILTRLDTFLRSRLVRTAVTEKEKPLDFRHILDSGKIFLAKLSQGAIGEENAALLGSLLVSKFHQTALSRQDVSRTDRRPFYLFLDEFHEFATPSMASLFSGVRKYNLGLCVAHQDLYQLHANAPEVERAVLTNAYTRIVFRAADEDGRKLERGFAEFGREDFASLGLGEAIVRVGKRENAFLMRTHTLPHLDPARAEETRNAIRERSLETYGRPRMSVVRPKPPEPSRVKPAPVPVPFAKAESLEPVPALPGRGGAMHKYLQGLIRDAGHARGLRAEIEKEIAGGQRVDVLLTAEGLSIACEVAGVSTLENELGNIRKCLASGFTHVCAISLDAPLLKRIGGEVARWPDEERTRVQTLAPEEFVAWLGAVPIPVRERRVAGYSVRVTSSAPDEGTDDRQRAIADVLMKSVRRMKDKA